MIQWFVRSMYIEKDSVYYICVVSVCPGTCFGTPKRQKLHLECRSSSPVPAHLRDVSHFIRTSMRKLLGWLETRLAQITLIHRVQRHIDIC